MEQDEAPQTLTFAAQLISTIIIAGNWQEKSRPQVCTHPAAAASCLSVYLPTAALLRRRS